MPHPELTTTQRQHLRQTAANPVRPFLTRGSVAERVLIFERCPSDLLLDKRVRAPAPQLVKPQVSAVGGAERDEFCCFDFCLDLGCVSDVKYFWDTFMDTQMYILYSSLLSKVLVYKYISILVQLELSQ